MQKIVLWKEEINYCYPVDNPKLTCRFGVAGKHWACGYHTGIDFSNLKNDNIYAMTDGVVYGVNHLAKGYGNHIEIRHNDGTYSLSAHLRSLYVQKGQMVSMAEVVGLMGSTGNSTAKHLHFSIQQLPHKNYPPKNLRPYWLLDPLKYLTGKGVMNVSELIKVTDSVVKVGHSNVPSKLIDNKNYVELRSLVEAIKGGLEVTWTEQDGATVRL